MVHGADVFSYLHSYLLDYQYVSKGSLSNARQMLLCLVQHSLQKTCLQWFSPVQKHRKDRKVIAFMLIMDIVGFLAKMIVVHSILQIPAQI